MNVRRLTSSLLCALLLATGLLAISGQAANASGYYSVVSSGLVINLDASNASSYSGSGTTWSDLSGNSNNATLYNSPTFSATNNGGAFSFSGGAGNATAQYAKFPSLSTNFSSGFSATFFADFGSVADNWERIIDFGNGNQANNILLGRSGSTNDITFEGYGEPTSGTSHDAGSLGHCNSSGALNVSGFHHWAITFSSGTCAIYRDGVALPVTNTFANGATLSSTTKTTNFIGHSNWSADNYFEGGIAKLAIYNRGLTSAEAYQNYQAQADTCSASQSTSGGWTIFQITATGTCQWFRPTAATSVEALIVGGGGAGGYDVAGGGGAGGLLYYGSENPKTPNGSALSLNQESYTVTVGAGGLGTSTSVTVSGSNGGDSSFGSYVAKGGGGGNSRNVLVTAATGGSGGGGGLANQTSSSPGMNGGNGTSNQGNKGGNVTSTSSDAGGGGGGAGGAGADRGNVTTTTGLEGKGGDGLQYSITGTATYYAGGGGGGSYNSVGGNGGLGGGGHGGNKDQATCAAKYGTGDCGSSDGVTGRQGKPGVANTGGGGGGSGNEVIVNYPGNGGSGVVILRFQNSLAVSAVNSISFSTQIKKLLANTITATVTAPGKVSFFANGRPIPRCANIATTLVSPFTAQCLWKPLVHGQISVTTSFVPNDVSYTNANGGTSGVATKRTTSR